MIVRFEEPTEKFKEYLPENAQSFDCKEFELHPWHWMWWELMWCKFLIKICVFVVPSLKNKFDKEGPRVYVNNERMV